MSEIVASADFQSKVLEADKPVLDEIATEVAGNAYVYKVDIDQSPDVAARYGVNSVPTLIVFENGQIKAQTVGAQPKQNILALLG